MESAHAVRALAALAQPTRLAVFRALVVAGEGGLTPGALQQRFGLAPATLSFHPGALRHAGLLTQRRDGRHLVYRADYPRMRALLDYLGEACCGGEPCAVQHRPAGHLRARARARASTPPVSRPESKVSSR